MPIENLNLQNKKPEELEQLLKTVTTTRTLKENEYEQKTKELEKLEQGVISEKTDIVTPVTPQTTTPPENLQKNNQEKDNTVLFNALLAKLEEDKKDKQDLLFYKNHLQNLREQKNKERVVADTSEIIETPNQDKKIKEETSVDILRQMKEEQVKYDKTKSWKISELKEIRGRIEKLQEKYDKKVVEEGYNKENTK